jgi:HK97 family phage major capsid protein
MALGFLKSEPPRKKKQIQMQTIEQLRARRAEAYTARLAITDHVRSTRRDRLTADENCEFNKLTERLADLDAKIADAERSGRNNPDAIAVANAHNRGYGPSLADQQLLTRDQNMADWCRDNGRVKPNQRPVSFDRYLRGIVTGNWDGADEERVLAEGTLTAGGHLVPTPLAGNVIDLARNASRVIQAGAVTVPMTSQTLKVARLTGEGAPAWRNENAAVTAGDLTFDAVTFTARSLDRLVIMSRELFEDSDPSASDVIARSFAQQLALELDRVALRGTGSAPEPRGVLNTAGITTTTHGANGAAITNYDFHLDAAGAVRNNNFEPTAHIQAPRTTTSLSKLKESTTNAYLAPPSGLLPMLPTKQIPVNLTVGTSVDCSEIYTAQWNQLAIGIRTGFELRVLTERYADNQQLGFIGRLRADVQLLQPSAFVVDTGVRS